jgi:hypothetical protein
MPVEPIHPNPHVVAALQALSDALNHLNMAGYPYAVGMKGVDEPYGIVQRAADRTLAHAFPDLDADEIRHARVDSGESYEHAVRALRQERDAYDVITYRWQFCKGGYDITDQPFGETDADKVRAWDGAHGDTCIVEVIRTPRGRWRITSVESGGHIPVSAYDRRFPSPLDALGYVAQRQKCRPIEAVCRCEQPGAECD